MGRFCRPRRVSTHSEGGLLRFPEGTWGLQENQQIYFQGQVMHAADETQHKEK